MARITKAFAEKLPPRAREYLVRDSELKGFCVRVQPSGHRAYLLVYRFPSGRAGRSRKFTLGEVPLFSTDQIRTQAQHWLSRIRQGEDPMAARQAVRHAPTVADLAVRYLAEHADVKKKPRSAEMDHVNLRLHVLPVLGPRLLQGVTQGDVSALHARMHATPGAANRVLALLSKMFSLAEQWGLRAAGTNPVRGVQRYRERKVERYLTQDEVARLFQVLAEASAMRTEHRSVLALIRLLVLTGARLGELRTLRWSAIDAPRGCAILADSKTGRKVLRLSRQALAVLATLEHPAGTPWVFPGRVPGSPLTNPHKAWARLCARAGLGGVRLHDLRHTWATTAAMHGIPLQVIGGALGHQHTSTTARYAHAVPDAIQAAVEAMGALLGGQVPMLQPAEPPRVREA